MKLEFVTHGLETTEKTVSNYINDSLEDEDFTEFHAISAFTRKSGLNQFKKSLLKNKSRFNKITFTLGIVPMGTTIEALEFLLSNEIECYTYFNERNMLHTKIYYFKGNRFTRFIIGSSNLTAAGLKNNIESSVIIEFKSGDRKGAKFIKQYLQHFGTLKEEKSEDFIRLNTELLNQLIEDRIIFHENYNRSIEEYEKDTAVRIKKSKKKYKNSFEATKGKIQENFQSTIKDKKKNLLSENYLKNWDKYLEIYKAYIKETGRTVVSKHTRISGLLTWYFKQKKLFREDIIPESHLAILNSLNFPFEDAHKVNYDKAFMARVEEFKAYVIKFNTNQIPRTRDNNNPYKSLSDWVALTRSDYNLGKVSKERIEILREIDFPFIPENKGRKKEDDSWMDKYFKLMEFKRVHGHCNAPQYNEDNSKNEVGIFVNEQRILGTKGRMKYPSKVRIFIDPVRKELLDELGFEWDYEKNKHKRTFEKRVNEYLAFRKKYPNLDPPKGEFKRERDWRAQMKYRFDELPEYKRKIIVDNRILE